jgi:hypothetical protein
MEIEEGGDVMIQNKVWKVDVFLTEDDGVTRAEAVLHAGEVRGHGWAAHANHAAMLQCCAPALRLPAFPRRLSQ